MFNIETQRFILFLRRLLSRMISASQSGAANTVADADAFDDAGVDQGYDVDPAAATTTALARLSPALIKSGMWSNCFKKCIFDQA
jgi:hypothetical protein